MPSLIEKDSLPNLVEMSYVPSEDGGNMLSIYHVGNGSRCVVWNYDIFGFNGSRTREMADLISSKGIYRIFYI